MSVRHDSAHCNRELLQILLKKIEFELPGSERQNSAHGKSLPFGIAVIGMTGILAFEVVGVRPND